VALYRTREYDSRGKVFGQGPAAHLQLELVDIALWVTFDGTLQCMQVPRTRVEARHRTAPVELAAGF